MSTTASDRMSVAEMFAECVRLRDLCGKKAYVSLSASADDYRVSKFTVSVYEFGICEKPHEFFRGDDFAGPLAEAEAWINNRATVRATETLRKMALAIIEITDEHGSCSRRLLGIKGFSEADIDAVSGAACTRASEMAGNAPFSVAS